MKKSITLFVVLSIVMLLAIGSCKKDDVTKLCKAAPTVFAGHDTTLANVTSLSLNGITDGAGGTWSITQGQGGTIDSTQSPIQFRGVLGNVYKLKWEATNACGTTLDELNIALVDAGADMTVDQFVDNMHWINESCFKIQGSKFKIYTDPNYIKATDEADVILITHPHNDHFTYEDIDKLVTTKTIFVAPADCNYTGTQGQRVVLAPGQTFTAFGAIKITAVPAYNMVKTQYHPKSNNWVGYVVTMNGVTFYTAGDTERVPEMKDITTDIAMLPLGQTYTFNSVAEAAEAAKDIKATFVIPMHYGFYEGTEADAATFADLLAGSRIVVIKVRGR
jgi:L-ascorbate metabolism protein UlaG (beta-lactamase superfamily)